MRSNNTIRTNDGTRISISCYTPEESNGKIILVAPGLGLTLEYYDEFANFLCLQGNSVITFDYRGMGRSVPQKLNGYEARMHQWAIQDINAVLLYAKQNFPRQEIIYIGHGTGGEIIGLAPASQYINKAILVSSSLSCSKLLPMMDRFKINGIKFFTTVANKLYGYFPGKLFNIFDDLPHGVIHEWTNWYDNPNGLFDNFPDNNYRKLNIPILAFTFSDDWHCPPRAVKELLNRFENSTITWYHIKPKEIGLKKIGQNDFFHFTMKPALWRSLLLWINKDEEIPADKKVITIKRYILE
jgi:predicted alpha/beta hydrolase